MAKLKMITHDQFQFSSSRLTFFAQSSSTSDCKLIKAAMFFDKSCNPSFSTLPHSVRVLETNLLSLAKELISEICEIIDLFKS